MKAHEIYRALSSEPSWSQKSSMVRWIAARYYAGVESLEQLRDHAKSRPVTDNHIMPPELSEDEVQEIVSLR